MKAKFKFDQAQIKSFLLLHVEKIVFGGFVLALLLIGWSALKMKPYDKTPQDLTAVADGISKKVEESKPPEKFEKLAQVPNFTGLGAAGPALVDAEFFRIEPLERPYQEHNIRRAMPKFLPVTDLLVSTGYGPIAVGESDSLQRLAGGMGSGMGDMMGGEMPGGNQAEMMKGMMQNMQGMQGRRPPGGQGPPSGVMEGMRSMMQGMAGGGRGGRGGGPGGPGAGNNKRNRREEQEREKEEKKKKAEELKKSEEAAALAARKNAAGEHVLTTAPGGSHLEGRYWVCLVGAIPAAAQFQEFHNTFRDSTYPDKSRNYPDYVRPDIERAEVIAGEEPRWQSIDVAKAWDDMRKWAAEYPDVVPAEFVEVIAEPLPALIGADFEPTEVSHPKIPLLADVRAEEERQAALKKEEAKSDRPKDRRGKARSQGGGARGGTGAGPTGGMAGAMAGRRMMGGGMMGGGMMGGGMGGGMGRSGMGGYGQMMGGGMMGSGMMGGGMMGGGMMGGGMMGGGMMGGGMMGGGMMGGGMMGGGGPMAGYGGGMAGMRAGANARQTTRQPDWKLFRFFDFTVEPGKVYQYRVKLVFTNPNFGVPKRYLEDYADGNGEYREAAWSEPSPPIMVHNGSRMLAGPLGKETGGEPSVELAVKQFNQEEASEARRFVNARRGAVLNEPAVKVLVRDPTAAADGAREIEIDFETDTMLVDILGGDAISVGRGPRIKAPAHVLVLRGDGQFAVLDEAADSQTFEMEKAEQKDLKAPEEKEADAAADSESPFNFNFKPAEEKPSKKKPTRR